jgi:hypothetical protein
VTGLRPFKEDAGTLNYNELSKYWKRNKRQIKMTITYLNRHHIESLSGARVNEISLDNIYSKLILPQWISLLEVEFNILIYENVFHTLNFIEKVNLINKSLVEKWVSLIEYFFKDKYMKNQRRKLTKLNIGDTNFHRYESLIEIINEDLTTFIEMRNRLSHGQYAAALNYKADNINTHITKQLWTLSKKEIMFLRIIVKNLPTLIKLLIISKPTFERDYDKYIFRIQKAKNDADIKYEWLRNKKARIAK